MTGFVSLRDGVRTRQLAAFLGSLGDGRERFRYFDRRPLEVVLHHDVSLLYLDDDVPIAYGHLEREDGVLWLGVAVAEGRRRQGYGRKMMEELIGRARRAGRPAITLTVDKGNAAARALYLDLGFRVEAETPAHHRMVLTLAP